MMGEMKPLVPTEAIRSVREGHGANCSSVGSVVDTLFLGAVAGGAVLAAVAAAMRRERLELVGETPPEGADDARANAGDEG